MIFSISSLRASALLVPVIAAVFAGGAPALADAGWISVGGNPHLLSENPTVSMKSEIVDIVIFKDFVRVDSRYVFVNAGPACKVRMGFPDEPSEVDGENTKEKPFGTFLTYEANIDGIAVPVETVVEKRERLWHANYVDFGENQTRTVRNVYTTCPNVMGWDENNCCFVIGYILSTAASWHGPLKSADINITIEEEALPKPLQLIPYESLKEESDWKKTPRGAVCCDASVVPALHNRTISLKLENKKPGKDDDITVMYGHINGKQGDKFIEEVKKKLLREAIANSH